MKTIQQRLLLFQFILYGFETLNFQFFPRAFFFLVVPFLSLVCQETSFLQSLPLFQLNSTQLKNLMNLN